MKEEKKKERRKKKEKKTRLSTLSRKKNSKTLFTNSPSAHADLLAGHELQRPVRAEMQHRVGAEDLFHVGVERREAVVRAGRAGEQEAHRVALVAKGGLHADEDVAEALAVDEELGAVGVEVARGLA